MTRTLFALALIAGAGWIATLPNDVSGCGIVPRHNERVNTSDEAALIVWDDKTKTEHFIRRATFQSTGYDFGFLVPTPSKPDLDVANDDLFHELATITAPQIVYNEVVREVDKEFGFGCSSKFAASEAAGLGDKMTPGRAPGGVEVLGQKRVGDYDATTLVFRKGDGDDAKKGSLELAKWLVDHGYQSPPAVEKWLERYVNDEWCITAFKIASDTKEQGPKPPHQELRAKPIRMTFKAEKPFYPYREPETEPTAQPIPRLLRVFVVAPGRFAGKLGDGTKAWPGNVVWAGPIPEGKLGGLFQQAKVANPPTAGLWLNEFEDHSSPRPGTDEVYFERDADQAPVARPPHIITNTRVIYRTPWWHGAIYFGVPAALILGVLLAWRLARRV